MVKTELQEKNLTVRDLIDAFRRNRRFFYTTAAIVFLLTVLYCLFVTHRFEAVAIVQVDRAGSDVLNPDSLMGNPPAASDALLSDIDLQTEAGILESKLLGLRLIDELKLADTKDYQPRFPDVIGAIKGLFSKPPTRDQKEAARRSEVLRKFQKRLKIAPEPGTRLLDVKYVSDDPKLAADVVNYLVRELIAYGYEMRLKATQSASETLAKQLADLRTRSEEMNSRVAEMQRQTGIYSLGLTDAAGKEEAYSVAIDQFERAAQTMNEADQNRILKQAIYNAAKTGDAELLSSLAGNTSAGAAPSSVTNSLATIQALRAQEATLRGQLDQVTVKFGPAYPQRQELENSVRGIEKSIKDETERIRRRAENDFLVANAAYVAAQQDYSALKTKAEAVNNQAVEYSITKQEADASRNLYEDLLKRLKEAGVLEELRADRVTLVDPAIPPARRTKPPLLVLLLAGFVGSLVLGALAVLLVNATDESVHSPLLAESAGIPVLGLLPREEWENFAAGNHEPGYLEGVQAIRARLMSGQRGTQRTILVAGATPENLTHVFSVALAASAAQIGARVLLVETDMLHPALARRLRLHPEIGLSRLLAGDSTQAESISPYTGIPRLWVLPAGPIPVEPTALIASEATRRLLDTLRGQYDLIILDGPAVLPASADTSALAELADISLQVARMDTTTRAAMARVHDLLAHHSDQAVGVVFTDVSPKSSAFRKFYGYDPGSSSHSEPSYETA